MTCSSFVEMILCSLLNGNITVSYYCLSMCKFGMIILYLSYRNTQSAYIPLNELLQPPLLMLKPLGFFFFALQNKFCQIRTQPDVKMNQKSVTEVRFSEVNLSVLRTN